MTFKYLCGAIKNPYAVPIWGTLSIRVEGHIKVENVFLVRELGLILAGIYAQITPLKIVTDFSRMVKKHLS